MKTSTTAAFLALFHVSNGEFVDRQPQKWGVVKGPDDARSACIHHFGFDDESFITSGQSFQSPDNDALFLTQSDNGSLVVREEHKILWQSVLASERAGSYWSELVEGEGFIATYKGDPYDRNELIWNSASSGRKKEPYWVWKVDGRTKRGEHFVPVWKSSSIDDKGDSQTKLFLGIDCENRYVAVFKGTPDEPGNWIWRDRIEPISTEEAFTASLMIATSSPTSTPPTTTQAATAATSTPPATTQAATTATSTPPAPTDPPVPFSFYIMGDVPYTNDEAGILIDQISHLHQNIHPGSHFLVHLGDFNRPRDTFCTESHFNNIYDILRSGPLPTMVMIGDNDYFECPNRDEAWNRYLSTFTYFEHEWNGGSNMNVSRWDYQAQVDGYGTLSRPDMFSFYKEGILFISLALLNMKNEPPDGAFYEREAISLSWIKRHLQEYQDRGLRGIVMFSHAEESSDLDGFFNVDLKGAFDALGINVPVLYLCGDSHRWNIDVGKYWSQFTYVSVDRGACADPLLIEIAPVVNGEMQYLQHEGGNQFIAGDGLFCIDRQRGRYNNEDCN